MGRDGHVVAKPDMVTYDRASLSARAVEEDPDVRSVNRVVLDAVDTIINTSVLECIAVLVLSYLDLHRRSCIWAAIHTRAWSS